MVLGLLPVLFNPPQEINVHYGPGSDSGPTCEVFDSFLIFIFILFFWGGFCLAASWHATTEANNARPATNTPNHYEKINNVASIITAGSILRVQSFYSSGLMMEAWPASHLAPWKLKINTHGDLLLQAFHPIQGCKWIQCILQCSICTLILCTLNYLIILQ